MAGPNYGSGVREVTAVLKAGGYQTFNGGWPDLLAFHPVRRNVVAFEIKWGHDKPSSLQRAVNELLWRVGLPTFEVRNLITSEAANRALDHALREGTSPIVMHERLCEALREPFQTDFTDRMLLSSVTLPAEYVRLGGCVNCGAPVVLRGVVEKA